MDNNDKAKLKGELQVIQANLQMVDALVRSVAVQGSMPAPVAGNVVIIPAFQIVSQALQSQKDTMQRMTKLMEQILDKV